MVVEMLEVHDRHHPDVVQLVVTALADESDGPRSIGTGGLHAMLKARKAK